MNIALVQLPHSYGSNLFRDAESYPLGLAYISSVLSENNIEHKGIDLWSKQYSVDEAIRNIDFSNFDFIGVSAYSTQYKYLKLFTAKLKEHHPDIPIICGGPGPTFSADTILLNTCVDVCVISEGEDTTVDLLKNFKQLHTVKGIAYKRDSGVFFTPQRMYRKDIDNIPMPNRELFDLEGVIQNANRIRANTDMPELKNNPRRSADIIAGRGCPYQCSYCSKTFSGCRLRSIPGLINEVTLLKDKYRIDHLRFNDELVVVGKKRTMQLCSELRKLNMTFSCQGRIDLVDYDTLAAMKEAGCIEIGYGVESVSQSILDKMNKGIRAEMIVPTIKMTKTIGIKPIIQYMYGYPGEDDKTIAETVKFFKEIDHPYIGFTTTPMPGAKLYQDCLKDGIIKDEEGYLLNLDSGYNIDRATINLTGFKDDVLLRKKRLLKIKVMHNYFSRRPVKYIKYVAGVVGRKLKMVGG